MQLRGFLLQLQPAPLVRMGSAESSLSQPAIDEIITVSRRTEVADPLLEKLQALKIAEPLLPSPPPADASLTDILVRKPPESSVSGSLNPQVLVELFSLYREWQEAKTKIITLKQEEIENKIEVADALVLKLLKRFNYSVSAMNASSHNLSQVKSLQVEVGELKGRLTEVMSNCDALCRRIAVDGPPELRSTVQAFSSDLRED